MRSATVRVGLIADTHGLLRPGAVERLRGADHIVHAGDIGAATVVPALAGLAPVTVVRGNVDRASWADAFPATATLDLGGHAIYVVHDLQSASADHGCGIVVSGHSHRPRVERRDGILFVNPGSAGPRRFRLPVCVGMLYLSRRGARARLFEIE